MFTFVRELPSSNSTEGRVSPIVIGILFETEVETLLVKVNNNFPTRAMSRDFVENGYRSFLAFRTVLQIARSSEYDAQYSDLVPVDYATQKARKARC